MKCRTHNDERCEYCACANSVRQSTLSFRHSTFPRVVFAPTTDGFRLVTAPLRCRLGRPAGGDRRKTSLGIEEPPVMAISILDFWKLLIQSRLFTEEQCQHLSGQFAVTPGAAKNEAKPLAEWLVKQRIVSKYQ